jgi:AFG3 family protein
MENSDNNKGADKKPDKNLKARFNTNWIFAIIVLAFIVINLLYTGKTVQKTTTSDIKQMIVNRDIEKIVVINKEQAEIYLKKEALESDRYPKVPKPGTGFGMSLPKAQYTYNIGDMSNFEPFLLEAQRNAGYTDKELIYPDYQA